MFIFYKKRIGLFIKSGAGFTLAEILVVIALLVILITIGVQIFLYNNRFYENQAGEIFSITATRETADRINEYARAAVALENTHLYGSTTYATDAQTVIFRIPGIDAAGQTISGVYDYAIMGPNPSDTKRLELIVDSPDPASVREPRLLLLTDKLTSIAFTYDNADPALVRKVDYEIIVTHTGRTPASEQIFGSATLRNK
ncbi:MAG: prepilin-type N-terminal cleavage/methylation domain-containing protein [Candidatus Doudnabacteria bacterium]|nr:prepilin-type N-terminal cleavage/methylation domain-containing protein [Candidatus Doudnabacteria bacterium]